MPNTRGGGFLLDDSSIMVDRYDTNGAKSVKIVNPYHEPAGSSEFTDADDANVDRKLASVMARLGIKYSESQPRVPAGSSEGGQFAPFDENAIGGEEEYPNRPSAQAQAADHHTTDQERLAGARVTKIMMLGGGISSSYKVELDDGTFAVWKSGPQNQNRDYEHEVFTSDLASEMGYGDLVAPAVSRDINAMTMLYDRGGRNAVGTLEGDASGPGNKGSLMRFMEQGSDQKAIADNIASQVDKEKMYALDFITGQYDRSDKHNWVMMPDGRPMAIDNGLSGPQHGGSTGYDWGLTVGQRQGVIPEHVQQTAAATLAKWNAVAVRMEAHGVPVAYINGLQNNLKALARPESTWREAVDFSQAQRA